MQKFILILFVGVLGLIVANQTMETPIVANDIVLENVEALAQSEMSEPIICKGSGDVTCPISDRKFAYVFIGYSLR